MKGTLTWSFRRRSTKGVIIFLAREIRSCESNVTLVSPLTLNMARSEGIALANWSGKIKFRRDWKCEVDQRFMYNKRDTNHKLLQVVLERGTSK